jgi:hypothetical protein
VAEVILSSLVVRRPRRFGDCWIGCKLWEELGLRAFWDDALGEQRGQAATCELHHLLESHEPLYVLTMIVRQFRLILSVISRR